MSMRSQVYEWTGSRTDTGGNALTATQAGKRISVFIGGYGNNITKPAETTAPRQCGQRWNPGCRKSLPKKH